MRNQSEVLTTPGHPLGGRFLSSLDAKITPAQSRLVAAPGRIQFWFRRLQRTDSDLCGNTPLFAFTGIFDLLRVFDTSPIHPAGIRETLT